MKMDNKDAEEPSTPTTRRSDIRAMFDNATDLTEQTRLKTSINDLPDEIILKIMYYEFVILGSDMYIYDFPGPAAVCQKWFMIYFEMYWRKWGFLKSKRATIEQWIRLARAKNGVFPLSNSQILSSSSAEQKPMIMTPKSATPPPSRIPKLVEKSRSQALKADENTTFSPILESELSLAQYSCGEIARLNASDAKELTTKDTWKTVMKRGRKRGSKPATSALGNAKEDVPDVKPKSKSKAAAFPFKIIRLIA